MKTFPRYLLLQIPGWLLVGILLMALHRWMSLPLWVVVLVLALDVAKDFLLYPYLRRAYEVSHTGGAHRFIGQVGVVSQPLNPDGYIRLQGDLWQARAQDGAELAAGSRVRVVGADGLVLIVASETVPPGAAPQ